MSNNIRIEEDLLGTREVPAEAYYGVHTLRAIENFYIREGANKQVISSQADSLIKISRIWADFFPANTSNQPI
ncbi:hypothetical protein AIU08_21495 [Salmonella enterica subsp. enterica serovar Senftenberg]|uniref:Aspartate ammonia-lyase n=1 Tax=Salmonella senftenberg TaxID=28150 RepID=A0A8E6MJ07_SALSE|nr:hypothetical protein AIU08_21495 [Salmonella enterica subsp. enterica serovar Senftenberg]